MGLHNKDMNHPRKWVSLPEAMEYAGFKALIHETLKWYAFFVLI